MQPILAVTMAHLHNLRILPALPLLLALTPLACGDDTGDSSGGGTAGTAGTATSDGTSGTASTTGTGTGTASGTTSDGSTGTASGTAGSSGSAGDTGTTGGGICGGAVSTFEDGKTPSDQIHVRPDGADGAGCGAEMSPCATLDFAAGLATPGTAIVLHEGTYAGGAFISGLAGTENAPIWIGGAPGEARPVFEGGAQAFQLSGVRYLIVHDIEVRNTTANGINCDDGGATDDPDATRFLVFRDLYLHDVGMGGNQDCLKLSGVDDYWVLDSEFARCGGGNSGSAIDHVGCHAGLIHGNYFHDQQAGGNAVQCKGGSEDLEIRNNLFEDSGPRGVNMGGSTGFEFFRPPLDPNGVNAEARDIRVLSNVFRRGVTPFAFVGCVGCLAANNTIDSPERWVTRILQETTSTGQYTFAPASDSRLVNNIVYFNGDVTTAVNVGADTAPDTFTFANNLWYRYDAPNQSDPPGGLPTAEQGGLVGMDPQFVDPAAGDFRLQPGSPAAGAGQALPELSDDMDSVCYADPPSIGAYELPE